MDNKTYKRLEFLKNITSYSSLSKDNVNLNIWCPFCKHKSKSKLKLSVHLEKGFYHCWLCDSKGTNIPYLVSKINRNKTEEAKTLFKTYNKKFNLFGEEEEIEEIFVNLPENFSFLVENFSTIDPDGRDVLKYAIKRGFNKHKIFMLRPGFSLNHEYKRYLILPSYNKNGELNYYTSRKIDAKSSDSYKYKNASVSKKDIVFNEINVDWKRPLTLVEGPLDLIKTNDNATCLLGSSLTEDSKLFYEIVNNRTPIKLALDRDAYSKTLDIAELLVSYDISVEIINTKFFEDVGEMTHEQFKKFYDDAKQYNKNERLLNKIRLL
jgi:transcription elongation factor Elf1